MVKFLSSPFVTILLFASLAGYVLWWRLTGVCPGPAGVVGLASALIAQSVWAIIYRLLMLRGKIPELDKLQEGRLLGMSVDEAVDALKARGLSETGRRPGDEEMAVCFARRRCSALVLEALTYGALVFTLLSGLVNYGFEVKGQVDLFLGERFIDLSGMEFEKGFWTSRTEPALSMRAVGIKHSTADKPSAITIEVMGEDGTGAASHRLLTGESLSLNRYSVRYMGDYYTAYPMVSKKYHDYMPRPVRLDDGGGLYGGVYAGSMVMGEPLARGEVGFDPASETFGIKVSKGVELEFDGKLTYGETASHGDLLVQVSALTHSGTVELTRYGCLNLLLGGMAVMALFLFLRLIFRPQWICLWRDGERRCFYTPVKALRRMLGRF